jgi:protein phosphatase 2C family protein 2/3
MEKFQAAENFAFGDGTQEDDAAFGIKSSRISVDGTRRKSLRVRKKRVMYNAASTRRSRGADSENSGDGNGRSSGEPAPKKARQAASRTTKTSGKNASSRNTTARKTTVSKKTPASRVSGQTGAAVEAAAPALRPEVGFFASQGQRDYMEDTHCEHPTFMIALPKRAALRATEDEPLRFFGVFDGHGGVGAPEFAAARLPRELRTDLEAGLCPAKALCNASYATEVAFFRERPEDDSGTTAVCALVEPSTRRVWTSNLGDSRCLLVRRTGAIVPLSEDQDADNRREARRIKAAGGTVEDGYVNDSVQVSRSIGDTEAKFLDREIDGDGGDEALETGAAPRSNLKLSAAVVPTPEVTQTLMGEDDIALVLACDGLFEAHGGSNAWVNRLVRAGAKAGQSAQEIARRLVETALEDGSEDNVTAVVVLL